MEVREIRGRWARELTERELKEVLNNAPKLRVAEWDIGFQFFASPRFLAIIRTSGMGGDTFNVHGGWRYANLVAFLQDWTEICAIAKRVSKWEKGKGEEYEDKP